MKDKILIEALTSGSDRKLAPTFSSSESLSSSSSKLRNKSLSTICTHYSVHEIRRGDEANTIKNH